MPAAHCIKEKTGRTLLPRDIVVILGSHNIIKRIESGRVYEAVQSIKIHDKWNPKTIDFEGDIAILKLANRVTMNEFVRPICLANLQQSNISNGTVAGWGVHDDTDIPSDIPRKAEIPILSDRECLRKNQALSPIFSDDLFCAGKTNSGVCKGDSGSGFYVQMDGKFYLRGIVSSSTVTSCSQSNLALYSDVLKNIDFIREVRLN